MRHSARTREIRTHRKGYKVKYSKLRYNLEYETERYNGKFLTGFLKSPIEDIEWICWKDEMYDLLMEKLEEEPETAELTTRPVVYKCDFYGLVEYITEKTETFILRHLQQTWTTGGRDVWTMYAARPPITDQETEEETSEQQ